MSGTPSAMWFMTPSVRALGFFTFSMYSYQSVPSGTRMSTQLICSSGQDYFVEELLDQWYGPEEVFFKVRTIDGNVYILRRRSSVPEAEWSLESFRPMSRGG